MFQGMIEGASLYVLRKKENKGLKIGQVKRVSNPYVPQGGTFQGMVVDAIVSFDGEEETIKWLPSLESLSEDKSGVVYCDNKDMMLKHVEAWEQSSKQVIESIPHHEEVIAVADPIKRKLNPALEAEKQRDEKISKLESRMDGMDGKLDKIVNILDALNK